MKPKAFDKKIYARFCVTPDRRDPVREWLLDMDAESRQKIGKDIQKVELGWPVGLPVCRALGRGLWEVRSDLPNGTIARVIFSIVGDEMVLLHGFIKKTQKTPSHEIDIAIKRLKLLE